jgi:hypothetical protein
MPDFAHTVHGVAQIVPQGENLNNHEAISGNFVRAKKSAGSVKQIIFVYYQIRRNFSLLICSSWLLNRKLLTERPTEGNINDFVEHFVLLPG